LLIGRIPAGFALRIVWFHAPFVHRSFNIFNLRPWRTNQLSTFLINSRAVPRVLPLNLIFSAAASISGLIILPNPANTPKDARAQSGFLLPRDLRSIWWMRALQAGTSTPSAWRIRVSLSRCLNMPLRRSTPS
jgi:hypothetical protein